MLLCNHAPCRCEVDEGQDYCGDYCRQEPQTGMDAGPAVCRCRHAPCGSPNEPAVST
jgi:hypothetical protein